MVGYRRVSKREQAREGKTSLADQTRAITARAIELGLRLLARCIFEDRSSGEDVDARPGFQALLAFCRAHPRPRSKPGHVLVLDDSRFGRFDDPDESAHWRHELRKVGWIVRFAVNDTSTDKTASHLMRAIGSAQATEYRDNLKRHARDGARGAAELGLWQNEAPVGYRRLASAPGRPDMVLEIGHRKSDDQEVRLTLGPEGEWRAVVEAFERYADGTLSKQQVVVLMRARVKRLTWSKTHVGNMLSNPAYLGHVVWCRRPHDKHERAERPVRPESEWVVTRDAHPALVSQELFDAAGARLAANRRGRRSAAGGYPLSGLIRCALCREPYVGGGGPKNHRDPSDPDRYRFYKDRGGEREGVLCPGRMGTLSRRKVEPAVINAVAEAVGAPDIQEMIRQEIERYLAGTRGDRRTERRGFEKALTRLAGQRDRVVAAIASGVLKEAEAHSEMERIRAETKATEEGLEGLSRFRADARELERERERLAALAADFPARVRELGGAELRALLEPWIESAVFDKETRELTLSVRRIPVVAGISLPIQLAADQRVLSMGPKRRLHRTGGNRRTWPSRAA
ncbi:MAG: hypothetical protein AVDCRST_MAG68-3366 [uncultured Gemmatimonadetes bacterium]|uniref:Recombinase domain-containing protein n=1 Tax=uncultured Gemmatimonadota bacterium TaxID=203437 RepID=A0A6J4LMB8_9BACT|nr:MAG: hypothetical protein AVDCRST_MAG68-3366 [uncultured Gemmatimonadota bacterium]